MKFMHLADLHIGKRMNDLSLIEDQKYAMNQVVEIAKGENVDLVLISGDVFDKSIPSDEAFLLYGDFINNLYQNNIKVYMIAGNHDSIHKLNYASNIFKNSDIFISDTFNGEVNKYPMTDDIGEYFIYMLPYFRVAQVAKIYPDLKIETLDDAFKAIIDNMDVDYTKRNILLMHQFLIGAERSESEEVSVGGLDALNSEYIKDFDYVALGHLHKAQKVTYENIRYSGSLLKYSFSEVDHIKGPVIVSIGEKGDFNYKQVPITYLHDVKIIKGTFDELMKMDETNDFLKVILTDEITPIDAKYDLQQHFPNMLVFKVENSRDYKEGEEEIELKDIENISISDMFSMFYLERTNSELNDKQKEIIKKLVKNMGANE